MPRFARLPLLTAVCAALVAAVLTVTAPAQAAVSAPTGLTPSGGTTGAVPVLAWDRIAGATSYVVETASDASFTTDLVSRTTVQRRLVPRTALKAGTVFWRVKARTPTVASPWASTFFTSTPTAPPALLDPPDGSVLGSVDPPLLTWTDVPGATSYVVDADGTTTTTKATSLLADGATTWRVKAVFAGGAESEWSEQRAFTVTGLPHTPLVSPEDGATGLSRLALEWEPVEGAARYEVRLGDQTHTVPVPAYAPGLLADGTYEWQVRPVDPSGRGPAWDGAEVRTFTVGWDGAATLLQPASDATVGDPLVFRWEPVTQAIGYTFEIRPVDGEVEACTTTRTTFVPTKAGDCWPRSSGQHEWRVRASNSADDVLEEAAWRPFIYSPATVPQVSPAPGAEVSVPTVTWAPVAGASQYKLTIESVENGSKPVDDRTVNTTTYTPGTNALQVGKTYRWSVQTLHANGRRGPLPAELPTFTMGPRPDPTNVTPEPVGPPEGSTFTRFPMLTWETVPDSPTYTVYLGDQAVNMSYNFPAGTVHQDPNTPRNVTWHVQVGPVAGSSRTFTIVPPDNPTGLTSDGALLGWSPVADAGHYKLRLSQDPTFAAGTTVVDTESTRFLPRTALADGTWHWQVASCVNGAACAAYSGDPETFNVSTPPVVAVEPASGADVDGPVTLRWAAFEGALGYRVQLSSSASFANPFSTVTVGPTSYTLLLPPGTTHWRVAALLDTTTSPYSVPRPVTRAFATPSLLEPLRWQPVPHAAEYHLEISRGPDIVLSAATTRPAFALAEPLPVGEYSWRVRPVDASDNLGEWATGSFEVAGSAPGLVSPQAGVNLPHNDSVFAWGEVPRAATYRFERRRGTTLVESTTTVALQHAPTAHIADASWEWRVVALDAAGSALGTSQWRPFHVDSVRPVVSHVRPGKRVGRKGNLTATFSEPVRGVGRSTVQLTRKGRTKQLRAKVSYSAATRTVTVNPAGRLIRGKKYVVRISGGIRDLHGLALVARSWTVKVK